MPSINDRRLASLYTGLETQRKTTPALTIGGNQVVSILAEIGDRADLTPAALTKQLNAANITRAQQVALVKKGMTAEEKVDLASILDQGSIPLEADAKNFIEAVLDRAPVNPGGPLTIVGDQKNGLSGTAKPGDQIEVINLTTAPGGRLHIDDTQVIATADAWGKFNNASLSGALQGDVIRMRARHNDGTTDEWVTLKATGLDTQDTRNAMVALFRIGLADGGSGKIAVTNINEGRQISEPGAKMQFTNLSTGEKTPITLDDNGTFPADLTLNGKAGDVIVVAASDGVNNADFSTEVGRLTIAGSTTVTDLVPDPTLHKDELDDKGQPKFDKARFTGPLFVDGPSPSDVAQGQLGDCYFPSAMAALAQKNGEAIKKMVKDNGDGTYTFTFQNKEFWDTQYTSESVKVDGDLFVRSWGGPLYGSSVGDKSLKGMELWFPLAEKAYATLKGDSYDNIGNGGLSSNVFEAVLGKPALFQDVTEDSADTSWSLIKTSLDAGLPVSAGTYGEDEKARYTNTGIYADHSYSILGYEEQNGKRLVQLRNPWGESEPSGNGENDGVFLLPVEDFVKLYSSIMTVENK